MTGRILIILLICCRLGVSASERKYIGLAVYGYHNEYSGWYVSDFIRNMKDEPNFNLRISHNNFRYKHSAAFIGSWQSEKSLSNPGFSSRISIDAGWISKQLMYLDDKQEHLPPNNDTQYKAHTHFEETRQEVVFSASKSYSANMGDYAYASAGVGFAVNAVLAANGTVNEILYEYYGPDCWVDKRCVAAEIKQESRMKKSIAFSAFIPLQLGSASFHGFSVFTEIRPGLGWEIRGAETFMKVLLPYGVGLKYVLK